MFRKPQCFCLESGNPIPLSQSPFTPVPQLHANSKAPLSEHTQSAPQDFSEVVSPAHHELTSHLLSFTSFPSKTSLAHPSCLEVLVSVFSLGYSLQRTIQSLFILPGMVLATLWPNAQAQLVSWIRGCGQILFQVKQRVDRAWHTGPRGLELGLLLLPISLIFLNQEMGRTCEGTIKNILPTEKNLCQQELLLLPNRETFIERLG